MNSDIDCIITRGEACDIDSIVQFQADMAMESEGCLLDREKVAKGVAAAMLDESKGVYWVAKFDGKTIGSLMITREWSDWNNEWYWWIQSVYVAPEYRRQGVYKAMYMKVKDAAKGSNVSQIRLYADRSNLPAQKVYKSLGMHESHYLMFEENLND
ncbi:MAG: GNAT family N-acetyltransferase [Bacteroidaceae bacterium]|nr:GNAT family N-acetyltransferase [Bacteroidaceae bacterium]